MPKGQTRSQERGAALAQKITKKSIVLTGKSMTMTRVSGVGVGTVIVEGLPEANVLVMGVVLDAGFTDPEAGAGDISATFDGDVALGTRANTDSTLAASDGDILFPIAIPQAVAGVASLKRGDIPSSVTDNTDGTLSINLNMLIDAADISGDTGVIDLSGVVHIAYITLGDD